ncbi:MAG: 4'-phosphopantetheinyl transferase superfamily protein [Bacillota bacterium]|nr:4'-phosphopantetheinyl transferase superfamily protein [Bacillota bacterium]
MIKIRLFNQYEKIDESYLNQLELLLPESRIKKAYNYKKEKDKINCILSYVLFLSLCKEMNLPIKKYEFTYEKNGKPTISGFPYYFNISHCDKGCVCAISDQPIGIDIQDMRKINPRLLEKVCSFNEQKNIQESLEKEREFFRIWTKKESLVKLSGIGLSQGLFSLDTTKNSQTRIVYENEDVIVSIAH